MPDDRDDDQDDGNDLVPRSHIRGLEEKARRADELAAEVERLQKDSIFSSALDGIKHPGLAYFKDGYKGEMTAEAIRQAAIEAGFGHVDEPAEQSEPQPEGNRSPVGDLAAHQRMAAAQTGAAPPPPFDFNEAMAKAQSPEELTALIVQHGEKYGIQSSTVNQ